MHTDSLRVRKTLLAAVGLMLASAALTGCNDNKEATPPAVVTNPAPPAPAPPTTVVVPGSTTTTAPAAGGVVVAGSPTTKINTNAGPGTSTGTDQATADAANAAIVRNKQMTGSRVEAVVTGGVCRLTGFVQNQQQKGLAETTARRVPGVSSVVNKLTIIATGGAKPPTKTIVVTRTKTKIIHVHDKPKPMPTQGGSPNDSGTGDNSMPQPPAAPNAPDAPATPTTPDTANNGQ
ncbi:MAG: BON domain-containing protein [Armatimonadota bacterium]|nr:BON domain-containing protein [Armatimonadota bacterium]